MKRQKIQKCVLWVTVLFVTLSNFLQFVPVAHAAESQQQVDPGYSRAILNFCARDKFTGECYPVQGTYRVYVGSVSQGVFDMSQVTMHNIPHDKEFRVQFAAVGYPGGDAVIHPMPWNNGNPYFVLIPVQAVVIMSDPATPPPASNKKFYLPLVIKPGGSTQPPPCNGIMFDGKCWGLEDIWAAFSVPRDVYLSDGEPGLTATGTKAVTQTVSLTLTIASDVTEIGLIHIVTPRSVYNPVMVHQGVMIGVTTLRVEGVPFIVGDASLLTASAWQLTSFKEGNYLDDITFTNKGFYCGSNGDPRWCMYVRHNLMPLPEKKPLKINDWQGFYGRMRQWGFESVQTLAVRLEENAEPITVLVVIVGSAIAGYAYGLVIPPVNSTISPYIIIIKNGEITIEYHRTIIPTGEDQVK